MIDPSLLPNEGVKIVSEWQVTLDGILMCTLPMITIWFTRWRDEKRFQKDRQLGILRTLMQNRQNILNYQSVICLNSIDIEFREDKNVLRARRMFQDCVKGNDLESDVVSFELRVGLLIDALNILEVGRPEIHKEFMSFIGFDSTSQIESKNLGNKLRAFMKSNNIKESPKDVEEILDNFKVRSSSAFKLLDLYIEQKIFDKYIDIVYNICILLKINTEKEVIKKSSYLPNSWNNEYMQQQAINAEMLKVLKGESPIIIRLQEEQHLQNKSEPPNAN